MKYYKEHARNKFILFSRDLPQIQKKQYGGLKHLCLHLHFEDPLFSVGLQSAACLEKAVSEYQVNTITVVKQTSFISQIGALNNSREFYEAYNRYSHQIKSKPYFALFSQSAKLQKKAARGVHFGLYGIAY